MSGEGLPGFQFAPEDSTSFAGVVVRIPSSIRSKDKLLRSLAERLKFPAYFGHNWDALEECLKDLSWLRTGALQIRHSDVPLAPASQERQTYLRVLQAAAAKWQTGPAPRLTIAFPADCQSEVLGAISE